jgi:Rps23 Pro-64 3,4-dihydroxylase Tpa1-like proline 4-hydroxylase
MTDSQAAQLPVHVSPVVLVIRDVLERRAMSRLLETVVAAEPEFRPSGTVGDEPDHRRSLVLGTSGVKDAAGMLEDAVRGRSAEITELFPHVAIEECDLSLEITASGDGCYFLPHVDLDGNSFGGRRLSVVYYFSDIPPGFAGGELVLWETVDTGSDIDYPGGSSVIEPLPNTCVVFDPRIVHEIREVRVPSGRFSDGRFSMNGWFSLSARQRRRGEGPRPSPASG